MIGAEGEIPSDSTRRRYAYADLSGPGGRFATLDYSRQPPTVYVGQQVTLDELAIPLSARRATHELRQVAGTKVSCPNCGGGLDSALDKTERVGCPYCGSLLDCERGELKLLMRAQEAARLELVLPIGSVGRFGDDERTVIDARCGASPSTEVLLAGVPAVPPATGSSGWSGATTTGRGCGTSPRRTWTPGQQRPPTAEVLQHLPERRGDRPGVVGECYWKVAVGETADTGDYVRPPEILSREVSAVGESKEVNWSLGTYLTPNECGRRSA